jgi:D-glycero-D-manno-heptose 1,7-bisphosphate phosphatase
MRTLFLDRDGVINIRIPGDYIKNRAGFIFEKDALNALVLLSKSFEKIFVVTNQAGIAKGRMNLEAVQDIHAYLHEEVIKAGGRIDAVYFCPHFAHADCNCRKPKIGMATQALQDFPDLIFENAWMVGDSASDMYFGQSLGMKTALIAGKSEEKAVLESLDVTARFGSLWGFAQSNCLLGI